MEQTNCGDCSTDLTISEVTLDRCSSAALGVFYEGEPICDKCAVNRYDAAMTGAHSCIKCADCDTPLTTLEASLDKCSSAVLGVYYEGAPICDKCAVIRYNAAMIEWGNKDNELS